MNKSICTATVLIIAAVFCFSDLFSQSPWQTYPYSPPGSVLTFPDDDGFHPDPSTTTEWWYINLHLTGSAPMYKQYDVMLVYFRFANMRIFNIAESSGTFHTNVLQVYPTLTHQLGYWDLTYTVPFQINDYSKWTYPNDNIPYSYIFHAEEPVKNDRLDVTVTSIRPPLVVGGDGFVPLGDQGDSSFYYSYTNMNVTGTIRYNGATDNITSGIAWIDRQYGPFMVGVNADNKYEWFSLQLDTPGTVWGTPQSPSEFNIWQIFSDSSDIPYRPEWRLASSIYPDDSQDTSSSFIFERTGYWHDIANNKYYSNGWRFIDPDNGVCVDMEPNIDNQVIDVIAFKFWEGATTLRGTVKNQPVDGVGFAELVADFTYEIIPPSAPQNLSVQYYPDHYALLWSAGTAGTYPVGGYRIYRSRTNDGYWQYLATVSTVNYDDYSAPDSSWYYTVSAFDAQTATSASGYATPVSASPSGILALQDDNTEINIFPNPVNRYMTVVYSGKKPTDVVVEIFNAAGKLIFCQEMDMVPGKSWVLADFKHKGINSGIFVCKITTADSTFRQRFVVGD
ncbi:MAG: T9SS type A sorting domain-containing protein [Bacteroidetes bacterium]|nr:T9SS type A sorting domain-containing protein [Bacteroidota bacterium]